MARRSSGFCKDGEGYGIEIIKVNTVSACGTPEYIGQKEYLFSDAAERRNLLHKFPKIKREKE